MRFCFLAMASLGSSVGRLLHRSSLTQSRSLLLHQKPLEAASPVQDIGYRSGYFTGLASSAASDSRILSVRIGGFADKRVQSLVLGANSKQLQGGLLLPRRTCRTVAAASDTAVAALRDMAVPVEEQSQQQGEPAEQVGEGRKPLEELNWKSTFIDELPGDPVRDGPVRQVRNACYSFVTPSVVLSKPALVAWSEDAAALLDLDLAEVERPEFLQVFGGDLVLKGSKPYAQCYGGHQFGHWAGQLGDGRAITLGEVESSRGESWELQLKGAGRTPYSRHADGRAVLRSSIREFLASEALHWLGVPTTRALSLVTTGEEVLRDMFYNGNARMEPGAVVCRVAPSFLRFGSWQIHSSRGGVEGDISRVLADYVIRHHFPQFANLPVPDDKGVAEGAVTPGASEGEDAEVDSSKNKYTAWFGEVAERTGRLVAAWQAVGFTHGVLNTDNMSILGLTIDYGPYGFLDAFDPQYTPNTTDLPGRRYCFQAQPDVCLWNIVQLANALLSADLMSTEEAQHCISRYADTFLSEYQQRMTAKMGVKKYHQERTQTLLRNMAVDKVDFTNLFRALSGASSNPQASEEELLAPVASVVGDLSEKRREKWVEWLRGHAEQLAVEGTPDHERKKSMDSVNPRYILRNYLNQIAIEAAEKGDYSEVRQLLQVLKRPFEDQPGMEQYAQPPPDWAAKPGVCMLSCSS